MEKLYKITSLLLLLLTCGLASALDFNGELKFQQIIASADDNSLLGQSGDQDYQLSQISFRGVTDYQHDNWTFDLDYLLVAQESNELDSLNFGQSASTSSQQYFDLEKIIHQSNSSLIEHRLDRFNVKYSQNNWVLKAGRQAITWGNGVVFHPMDLFNPFSPDAKDVSYKNGIDAFYYQYLFDSGADVQFFYVPESSQNSSSRSADSSAVKYLFYLDDLQIDLLLARDFDDEVAGLGFVGPLSDAIWKLDLVQQQNSHDSYFSFDLNFQYSWTWAERPYSGHIEFYRNGYVKQQQTNIASFSTDLQQRLLRGQSFTASRDNLALGVQVQLEALWTLSTNYLHEFDQNSYLFTSVVNYNSSDSSNLIIGLQIPGGKPGSQYGGYYVSPLEQTYFDSGKQVYLRYEYFF